MLKKHHARSLCPRPEGFHTDVDPHRSVGNCRSGRTDSWIGYGHALGSLGERFKRHVPSSVVHVGYVCGNSCLLCKHSCLPYLTAIGNHRCGQVVENEWGCIFGRLWIVLVRIWDGSSCHHAQSSASYRWTTSPHFLTACSRKQAVRSGSNLSRG